MPTKMGITMPKSKSLSDRLGRHNLERSDAKSNLNGAFMVTILLTTSSLSLGTDGTTARQESMSRTTSVQTVLVAISPVNLGSIEKSMNSAGVFGIQSAHPNAVDSPGRAAQFVSSISLRNGSLSRGRPATQR